jgi:hypothetical protein
MLLLVQLLSEDAALSVKYELSAHIFLTQTSSFIFTPKASLHQEGLATGQHDRGFQWFSCITN